MKIKKIKNDKKGALFFSIITAIFIFMVGMVVINLIKPDVTLARNSDNLYCSNATNISDGTKLTCLAVDLVIPYFILTIVAVSIGVIMENLNFGGSGGNQ